MRRIGDFKSFGDTYARDSMSDAQREVTESLLSAVSGFKVGLLARDAGPKTMSEVEGLYNSDVSLYPAAETGRKQRLRGFDHKECNSISKSKLEGRGGGLLIKSYPVVQKGRYQSKPSRRSLRNGPEYVQFVPPRG